MTVYGLNLIVVARAFGLEIKQLGTYRKEKETPVTLYETEQVSEFLAFPDAVYQQYNAWLNVPTVIPHKVVSRVSIADKSILVPKFPFIDLKSKYDDLFQLANKYEPQYSAYSMTYTIAHRNNKELDVMLKETAISW